MTKNYKLVADYVAQQRKRKKKIILTQGSFDMLHIGHARYCKEAKKYGNTLIIGVDSDKKIRKRKGDDRPVVPEDERLEMLTHLSSVDLVVLKKLSSPKWELIKTIKPDVLIATKKTYSVEQIEKLKKICGDVVILDPMAITSTSAKIRLMQIEAAKKIESALSNKIIKTIEGVLGELRGEKK